MHRRILRGEQWRWFSNSLLLPLCAGGVVVALFSVGKSYFPWDGRGVDFLFVINALLFTFVATTLATPLGRQQFRIVLAKETLHK
jgi:hypothetical protein